MLIHVKKSIREEFNRRYKLPDCVMTENDSGNDIAIVVDKFVDEPYVCIGDEFSGVLFVNISDFGFIFEVMKKAYDTNKHPKEFVECVVSNLC
jgi:hypothetical protein